MRGDDRGAIAVVAPVSDLQAEEEIRVVAVGFAMGPTALRDDLRTRPSWHR